MQESSPEYIADNHLPRFLCPDFWWPTNLCIQGLCSARCRHDLVEKIPQGPAQTSNERRAHQESHVSTHNTDALKRDFSVLLRINHAFLT